MFLQLGDMLQMPIIIVVSFIFLFILLKWAFFSAILVFVIAFVCNIYIGNAIKKLTIAVMMVKDKRMKETTESLNNIKFLKLYGW